jgi:hypothetical protein
MNLELELMEADRQVDQARERIAAQHLIITRLEIEGGDAHQAVESLTMFEETLRSMIAHRERILRGATPRNALLVGVAIETERPRTAATTVARIPLNSKRENRAT